MGQSRLRGYYDACPEGSGMNGLKAKICQRQKVIDQSNGKITSSSHQCSRFALIGVVTFVLKQKDQGELLKQKDLGVALVRGEEMI